MRLYHGSRLKPGFQHTHELIQWDIEEGNTWLYATSNRDEAIRQGFYSLMSALFDVHRIQSAGSQIVIELDRNQPAHGVAEIGQLKLYGHKTWMASRTVYLYTLEQHSGDHWVKNNNVHNGLTNEWKTQAVLPVTAPDKIAMSDWLAQRRITIELVNAYKNPYFMRW